jgi:hypothetical protein
MPSWPTAALAVAALAAMVAGPAPAEAAAKKPRADLYPKSAAPHQTVQIWAKGFPARRRVSISIAGRRVRVQRARRDGRVRTKVPVPAVAPGRRLLRLRHRGKTARLRLNVVRSANAVTLAAAGDIACEPGSVPTATTCREASTAALVGSLGPDVVATLGDAQYRNGEYVNYRLAYDLSWGAFKGITRPAVGNHEYLQSPDRTSAYGHFTYFGAAAGDPAKGYYSYKLGIWNVFVLNTGEIQWTRTGGAASTPDDCWPVSCWAGSPQVQWLRSELRRLPPGACTLAYWHHPRYSSGAPYDNKETRSLFDALYDNRVELLLTGHTHAYERFRPMDADGRVDEKHGVTQFVVGTGGRSLFPAPARLRGGSASFDSTRFGVLGLTLDQGGYGFKFLAEDGVHDAGGGNCR